MKKDYYKNKEYSEGDLQRLRVNKHLLMDGFLTLTPIWDQTIIHHRAYPDPDLGSELDRKASFSFILDYFCGVWRIMGTFIIES